MVKQKYNSNYGITKLPVNNPALNAIHTSSKDL
jgi:hypothetical protein